MKSIQSKDLNDLKANNRQHENDDLSWLLTLDHLNVVKYFEIVELTDENYFGLETGSVNLIMEFCGVFIYFSFFYFIFLFVFILNIKTTIKIISTSKGLSKSALKKTPRL